MSEYLCVTVRSKPNEAAGTFKSRLSDFWTAMLRNQPDEFEKVYAETSEFENEGEILIRQYLIEAEIAALLAEQLTDAGIAFVPIDEDDIYSKYEAVPPEWFWIEH